MPKSIGGVIAFALASFATVVIGLAIVNRAKRPFPLLARALGE